MNVKQEIAHSKKLIAKYQNQISNCKDEDIKRILYNKLVQEQIKLESYELLVTLNKRVGSFYEQKDLF